MPNGYAKKSAWDIKASRMLEGRLKKAADEAAFFFIKICLLLYGLFTLLFILVVTRRLRAIGARLFETLSLFHRLYRLIGVTFDTIAAARRRQ
jgi:hypothetical protein